jgi:hypothetical protein
MIKVLKEDIILRLNTDVPGQPTEEELAANVNLRRYMLVFDREGYSITSYSKNPVPDTSSVVNPQYRELDRQHIAYCAETALCNIIKKKMFSPQRARMLIRKLYSADADIKVDEISQVLIVKIHRTNHWADDDILEYLCVQLNDSETVFPTTKLTCYFKMVSS